MTLKPGWLLAAVLSLPSPVAALELEGIRCLCAADATSHGDYVSCVSHLSRRLVASGQLTTRERSRLVRDAAHAREVPRLTCGGGPPRWGVGIQTGVQVLRSGETARIEGLIWNFTPEDVTGTGTSGDGSGDGPDECLIALELRDDLGVTVHRETLMCPGALTEYPLGSGRARRLPADVALTHVSSDAGHPDGTPLEPGRYFVRVDVQAAYPNRTPSLEGLRPHGEVLIRVEP